MKYKKTVVTVTAILAMIIAVVSLVGCDSKMSFNKIAGFKKDQVTKIELISEFGAGKDVTDRSEEIFTVLDKLVFHDNNDGKVASDMQINVTFRINFYINGVAGYYSMVFNNGFEAKDGFDNKKSKTGFYQVDNAEEVKTELYKIFHE